MSDAKTDQPTMVRIEMAPETLQRLAELMPAVAAWARAEGAPATAPGDVIAFAIALLHAQVFERAGEMLAEAGKTAPRPHVH